MGNNDFKLNFVKFSLFVARAGNIYFNSRQFPNVIGAIDGCHVKISANEDEKHATTNVITAYIFKLCVLLTVNSQIYLLGMQTKTGFHKLKFIVLFCLVIHEALDMKQ